jgi:hypothetical protein
MALPTAQHRTPNKCHAKNNKVLGIRKSQIRWFDDYGIPFYSVEGSDSSYIALSHLGCICGTGAVQKKFEATWLPLSFSASGILFGIDKSIFP